MKNYFYLIACIILLYSCKENSKNPSPASIVTLADIYYKHIMESSPEAAYYIDVPLENHEGISSNKLSDVAKTVAFQDSLYKELSNIDTLKISKKSDKITYWLLKESLESSMAMRVCKRNLWNVTHRSNWQQNWMTIAAFQPVDTEEFRLQAFKRWNKLPPYVATEIENLKLGISQGYTMPKEIVRLVIDQLQTIIDYPIENSPFMSPAKRAEDQQFYTAWEKLVTEKIVPAFVKYKDFLKNEYLSAAREEPSILTIPNGDKCYQAYVRLNTTTNKSGKEIFELGQQIVTANKSKVTALGKELYQIDNFKDIIRSINEDKSNYFNTSDEILSFNSQLLSKAKEASKNWFAVLPSTEVTMKPYASHETGRGSYEAAKGDKPAYFRISLKNPKQQKKGANERLTFHESYPGHHLQIGIEKDLQGMHPVSKLISFSSYIEGWGRYSEQLAEEMGLYESKAALIGRRAWPARGMVVDPGLHLMNWTKEEVINYIMEARPGDEDGALHIYHRIIIWPAQLTSYDVGGEEIKALRKMAKNKLGDKFDIKEFHSKVLENGTIPLSALRTVINEWVATK